MNTVCLLSGHCMPEDVAVPPGLLLPPGAGPEPPWCFPGPPNPGALESHGGPEQFFAAATTTSAGIPPTTYEGSMDHHAGFHHARGSEKPTEYPTELMKKDPTDLQM